MITYTNNGSQKTLKRNLIHWAKEMRNANVNSHLRIVFGFLGQGQGADY
jgi:hypothetical protein